MPKYYESKYEPFPNTEYKELETRFNDENKSGEVPMTYVILIFLIIFLILVIR